MSLFLAILLDGESAERAKQEAAKTVGPGFALHVTSLYINDSAGHKSISAVVTLGMTMKFGHSGAMGGGELMSPILSPPR